MKKTIILLILFLLSLNLNSQKENPAKNYTLIVQTKSPLEIKDVTAHEESNTLDKNMPWIVALLIGTVSAFVNFYIGQRLRVSNEKNLLKSLENAKEITLTQFKSTIATKNRQEWINDLRHSLSDFISYSTILMPYEGSSIHDDDNHPVYEKFTFTKAKIELLMNGDKPEQVELLNYLEDMLEILLLPTKEFEIEKFKQIRENIIASSRTIFQIHWHKIKALS